jgi:F420H(2)-dependent quinone reductase
VESALLGSLRRALAEDRTIDIITRGAKSGVMRTTEIWFTAVGGEIFICGTPSADGSPGPRRRRDWLANLRAHPEFTLVLTESVDASLPALATEITDHDERIRVFSAPETEWYRKQAGSMAALVDDAPLVRVTFVGTAAPLNSCD